MKPTTPSVSRWWGFLFLRKIVMFNAGDAIRTIYGDTRITYVRYQDGDIIYETGLGVFTSDEVEAIPQ